MDIAKVIIILVRIINKVREELQKYNITVDSTFLVPDLRTDLLSAENIAEKVYQGAFSKEKVVG